MTPRRAHVAALLVALALAGCGGADTAKTPPLTTTANRASPMPVETAAATATPVPQPEKAPEPKKTYPPPETLNGLDADGLAQLLGPPRLKRRDDPAEIWQYLGEACALDVFLYRAGKAGVYRVRHFETRGPGRAPVDQRDCFVGLLKAREQARAG